MNKILALLLAFKVAQGFLFMDPNMHSMTPIFNNPFWKNFENSMKELEASLKASTDSDSEEDSDVGSSEVTEMETPHDPFGILPGFFSVSSSKPWWMGKNVCVTKEETNLASSADDDADNNATSVFNGLRTRTETCAGGTGRYTCTSEVHGGGKHIRTAVKYECCHGHQLQGNRCIQVHLANLTETVKEVAPEFTRMLQTAGVLERLEKEPENFTLFVTGDDTLDDLRENFQEMNQLDLLVPQTRRRRTAVDSAREGRAEGGNSVALNKVLLNHVVRGVHRAVDMVNNKILESMSGDKLRMNVYTTLNGPITTVNCKRVINKDKIAEKGVVHVVDGVLKPVERSVAQIIREDQRFSIFRSMLESAGLMDSLTTDTVTIFAPTNAAFEAIPDDLIGSSCAGDIARHHVAPHVLCLTGLTDTWNFNALSKEIVRLRREGEVVTVNGVTRVTLADVVATNGVVHVLDQVLMPDAGKNMSQMLESRNLTTFKTLLAEAGLSNSDSNLTWFVPREETFERQETKSLLGKYRADPSKLRELLLYHSTQPQLELTLLNNEQMLDTRAQQPLRFNLYSTGPSFTFSQPRATVNCARVRLTDSKACGANIHETDRLLVPPSGDITATISDQPQFSILRKIIETAGIEELSGSGPLTLLAPTDDAFNDLPARILNALLSNETLARSVLQKHILPETICCHGVSGQQWFFPHQVAARDGSVLQARRDSMGHVHFGRTRVAQCDQIATNGIVHTVTRVIMPQEDRQTPFSSFSLGGGFGNWRQKSSNPDVEVLLFGL